MQSYTHDNIDSGQQIRLQISSEIETDAVSQAFLKESIHVFISQAVKKSTENGKLIN